MQKWEYMTWVVGFAQTTPLENGGGLVKYCNGAGVPNWKNGPKLTAALNTAGEQGWELVSVSYPVDTEMNTHVKTTDPVYVFKRQKPG